MTINLENFDFIKSRGEELYKSFEPVECPYFNELVYFTAEGLEHLKYKHRNHERSLADQYMRFKLLHLVPQVLKLSRTLQGRSTRTVFERVPINNKKITVAMNCTYFEFIAILEDVRLRVVVKKLENSTYQFLSVIPYWTKEGVGNKDLAIGNPND